jgi:hypothetical protein
VAVRTNFHRIDRAGDVHIIATFGHAQLVRHVDGRYELRGGSAADHTGAKEWISLFLHEAVVSPPPPVAGQMSLSGFAYSVSNAAVCWVRGFCSSHRFRPGLYFRREAAGGSWTRRAAMAKHRAGKHDDAGID